MGKQKQAKPPGAPKGDGSATFSAFLKSHLPQFFVAVLAIVVAALFFVPNTFPSSSSGAVGMNSGASERLVAPSPSDEIVADACSYVRPLWTALGPDDPSSCTAFLRDHWERQPLLSRPGISWNRALMELSDIAKMVGSWPIRFFKNHATVSLHKPNSGFLADFDYAERGASVPTAIVDIALTEQRTLVMHNLEVYWPPIGALVREVVLFFHAYTQVNLYMSPPGLHVATAPHQDAHSVFIVQTHGRKRWAVHAPLSPWTLKPQQRGKQGEVLDPSDRRVMGDPILNVTMYEGLQPRPCIHCVCQRPAFASLALSRTPGDVLYIPRAFFHHTSTHPALVDAPDEIYDERAAGGQLMRHESGGPPMDASLLADQPSMALTISILCEDVWTAPGLESRPFHHAPQRASIPHPCTMLSHPSRAARHAPQAIPPLRVPPRRV